ncbi:SGNH/GDSL hydrolase family protein [Thalassoglobus polymorphus]|nr:SGNH/GDSL hydrolase family protein [Thalassoglobus polymorphus]
MMTTTTLTLLTVLSFQQVATESRPKVNNDLQLTLPPVIYAVPGIETNFYFDNIILSKASEQYKFKVSCDVGESRAERWTLTPTDENVGKHPLKVDVLDEEGKVLASQASQVLVIPKDAGAKTKKKIRLLIIGDSLTHNTAYPNEIGRLLNEPGNPEWEMLGTHKPSSAAEGIAHEGYGGWTWARFVTHYEPNPDGTHRKKSSPFVFLNDDGQPALDVPRYFDEHFDGTRPDYIIIMLGINDCFSAPANDPKLMDERIDLVFGHAETLLTALRAAAPESEIGICLTTPPNSRQSAFEANYKERYPRWGWKKIQHRLVQREMEFVAQKNDPKMSLIPTQLNLDTVDGYPENNAVHPNTQGYQQVGKTIYSWLKWQLSRTP